jgi:hypothetical protein
MAARGACVPVRALTGTTWMLKFFADIFDNADLSPHGFCLLWRPELIWLHITSDSIIALSYYSIPLAWTYFVTKRRDLVFGWMFWLFGAFILACGATHYSKS